jgi:hypothetical protein
MAKKLNAPILTTGRLDPEVPPENAWREIKKLAIQEKAKSVLAITHGPLVEKLLGMLIGAPSIAQLHFAHAAIAHFDTVAPMQEAKGDYTYDEQEVKRLVLGSGGASGVNCEFCEDAADRGWVDMDEVFEGPDGDVDEPPFIRIVIAPSSRKRNACASTSRGFVKTSSRTDLLHTCIGW